MASCVSRLLGEQRKDKRKKGRRICLFCRAPRLRVLPPHLHLFLSSFVISSLRTKKGTHTPLSSLRPACPVLSFGARVPSGGLDLVGVPVLTTGVSLSSALPIPVLPLCVAHTLPALANARRRAPRGGFGNGSWLRRTAGIRDGRPWSPHKSLVRRLTPPFSSLCSSLPLGSPCPFPSAPPQPPRPPRTTPPTDPPPTIDRTFGIVGCSNRSLNWPWLVSPVSPFPPS